MPGVSQRTGAEAVMPQVSPFLEKALESLAGAESEFANRRFNNVASRCYYAAFQAAIVSLQRAGIEPRSGRWGHDLVPAQFEGLLINRRHLYPGELRDVLSRNYTLRQAADYNEAPTSQAQANHALRRTRTFLEAVQTKVGEDA